MKIRLIAAYVIALLVGGTTVAAKEFRGSVAEIATSHIKRANLCFAEMEYEHIDESEIEGLFRNLGYITDDSDKQRWLQKYTKLYNKIKNMEELIYLQSQLNAGKKDYFNEYIHNISLASKMKNSYMQVFEPALAPPSEVLQEVYDLTTKREEILNNFMTHKNLEDILSLIELDKTKARLQGYVSPMELYADMYGRSYTDEDKKIFIRLVKDKLVTVRKQYVEYLNSLDTDKFTNYKFKNDEEMLSKIEKSLIHSSAEYREAFDYLRKYKLYDINYSNKKNKDNAFTLYLQAYKEPFICINYEADAKTMVALIHEFGHFLAYYNNDSGVGGYDLSETYAQALELLTLDEHEMIFDDLEVVEISKFYVVTNILNSIVEGCFYEELFERVYSCKSEFLRENIESIYIELLQEYDMDVNELAWNTLVQNIKMPGYSFSYSISGVAALEIWQKEKYNRSGKQIYLQLLRVGRNNNFVNTIRKIGLANPFLPETIDNVKYTLENCVSLRKEAAPTTV